MTTTPPLDPRARDAAFALVYRGERDAYELDQIDEATLAAELAPSGASREACIAAVRAVRALGDSAMQVAEWVFSGALGEPPANELSRRHLANLVPGFSPEQYDAALARGLFRSR
jgi:hypothetical protein